MREIKTIEQYRERMIEAFHNAGYDELIAYVVLPFEEEFITLEKILKCWKKHSFYPSAGKASSETTPTGHEEL